MPSPQLGLVLQSHRGTWRPSGKSFRDGSSPVQAPNDDQAVRTNSLELCDCESVKLVFIVRC